MGVKLEKGDLRYNERITERLKESNKANEQVRADISKRTDQKSTGFGDAKPHLNEANSRSGDANSNTNAKFASDKPANFDNQPLQNRNTTSESGLLQKPVGRQDLTQSKESAPADRTNTLAAQREAKFLETKKTAGDLQKMIYGEQTNNQTKARIIVDLKGEPVNQQARPDSNRAKAPQDKAVKDADEQKLPNQLNLAQSPKIAPAVNTVVVGKSDESKKSEPDSNKKTQEKDSAKRSTNESPALSARSASKDLQGLLGGFHSETGSSDGQSWFIEAKSIDVEIPAGALGRVISVFNDDGAIPGQPEFVAKARYFLTDVIREQGVRTAIMKNVGEMKTQFARLPLNERIDRNHRDQLLQGSLVGVNGGINA